MLCLMIKDLELIFTNEKRNPDAVGRYVLALLYDKDSFDFIKAFFKKYGTKINNSGIFDIYTLFNNELKELIDKENLRKEKGLKYDWEKRILQKEECFEEMLRIGKVNYALYPRNSEEYRKQLELNKEVYCFPALVLYDLKCSKYKVVDFKFLDIKKSQSLLTFIKIYSDICDIISENYSKDFNDICDDINERVKKIKDLGEFDSELKTCKKSNDPKRKQKLIKRLMERKGVNSDGTKVTWESLAKEIGYPGRSGLIYMINDGKNQNLERLEKLCKALDLTPEEAKKLKDILMK